MDERIYRLIFLCFWIMLILLLSLRIYRHYYEKGSEVVVGVSVVEGQIISHPYEQKGNQVLKVGGISVVTSRFPRYLMGQYVVIEKHDKLLYEGDWVYYPYIATSPNKDHKIFIRISQLRKGLIIRTQKTLPEPYASIFLGMVIGYKADFPEELLEQFRHTGTIHILVVSGYNVALVLSGVAIIFSKFGRSVLFLVSIGAILFFVAFAGLDPPVIRAGIMGTISVWARITGYPSHAFYALFIAAVIMLFMDPAQIENVGFQLSFMATAAVILASAFMFKSSIIIRELAIIIAVQIALVPLLSYYFGYISLASVPANLLIAWVIPLIMFFGMLGVIFQTIIVHFFVIGMLSFLWHVVELLSFSQFTGFNFSMTLSQVVLYYAVILLGIRGFSMYRALE